jgi:hypothetical protein
VACQPDDKKSCARSNAGLETSGSISASLGAPHFAQQQFQAHHVRYGSKGDISVVLTYVRFAPKSGHR